MTVHALRPCQHPGCHKYAEPGKAYCAEHQALHDRLAKEARQQSEHKLSASQRGYTSAWRRVSRAYLDAHPFCAECLRHGIHTPATEVDHIKAWKGDRKLFWDENNWQALCHLCHTKKTNSEDGGFGNKIKHRNP